MGRVRRGLLCLMVAGLPALLAAPAATAGTVEVIAELDAPPLTRAIATSKALRASVRHARLDLDAPTSRGYLRDLARRQDAVSRQIGAAVPGARVRWRYSIVLDGLAVVLPERSISRLAAVPGVARIHRSVAYAPSNSQNVQAVKAPLLWGSDLSSAGNTVKIAILDDGVDASHPFFDARGYQAPTGFPLGQRQYTSGKVIVARAFAPANVTWKHAGKPFDPVSSVHGTHVAGIAAGNFGTRTSSGESISGVAPRAYIGNYKVLSVPTGGLGLNGNSPEIVAGIEAAVADGMDVINLSLGEPEVDPRRDLVARAIDAAAAAGVVSAIAAGNAYDELGRGSVLSPGTAESAITAGAVAFAADRAYVSSFSSSGPTPISLRLKPDVAAPGSDVLSSIPGRRFTPFSGTSMAAPHVAGAAALLRQRHPAWSPAQIKSALVSTATPVRARMSSPAPAPVSRVGGGLIDVVRADSPLLFTTPVSASFGLLRPGARAQRVVQLSDATGGAGTWAVTVDSQSRPAGVTLDVLPAVEVPGLLTLGVRVSAAARQGEAAGALVLTQGQQTRRIPYWLRVVRPRLPGARAVTLRRAGVYAGNTAGKPALVNEYRYPENPSALGIARVLRGPEQVFRFRLRRPVANVGVAIVSRDAGVRVQPRMVVAGDENRLTGDAGLPLVLNPFMSRYQQPALVAGAVRPASGRYDVVFDGPSRASAGKFRFRFWVDDTRPPALRLLQRRVSPLSLLRVRATDAGSGVDPSSVVARIDGRAVPATYEGRTGRVLVLVSGFAQGRHTLSLRVSDYQETKNMENVARVLPNTTTLTTSFVVAR